MADHEHDHAHDPGPSHGHLHHGHSHAEEPQPAVPMDAAASSLARALQMSFRVLTLAMIVVAVLYCFTGVATVNTGEKGIVTIFGGRAEVVGPGLHYTWPFPIGHIDTVSVKDRVLEVRTFWMGETPEDKSKTLAERTPPQGGLRPGWDGALLTGDAYVVHMKLRCTYAIEDVLAYRMGMADPNGDRRLAVDPNEAVEAAVCSAAIRAAAHRTAESLVSQAAQAAGAEQESFAQEVRDAASENLRKMGAGITLRSVQVLEPTWPLRVLDDATAAQNAAQREEGARQAAIQGAEQFLGGVAGPNYRKLVGEPWDDGGGALPPGQDPNDYDLIGQYERARHDPAVSEAECERLLARIDAVLLSPSTTGEVAKLLSDAAAYKSAMASAVQARSDTLQRVAAGYDKAPEFFLLQKWTEAREEILQSPTIVKWYLNPGQGKTVVQINTPPEITKEIAAWLLRNPSQGQKPPGAP